MKEPKAPEDTKETDAEFSKKQDLAFAKKAKKQKAPRRRSKALLVWKHQDF